MIPNNLRYFGYYYPVDIQNEPPTTHYLSEIDALGNSNITYVPYLDVNLPLTVSMLAWAQTNGYKVILEVNRVFELLTVSPSEIYTDWETRWFTAWGNVQAYSGVIYAFYFDEPMLHGYSVDHWRTITQRIKTDTGARVMITEAFTLVDATPQAYYDFVDDLGIDWYFAHGVDNAEMHRLYEVMESKATAGQRFWVIPETYMQTMDLAWYGDYLPAAFDFYMRLATYHPRIVGVLNFLYGRVPPGTYYGARDIFDAQSPGYIPALKQKHLDAGAAIIARDAPQDTNYGILAPVSVSASHSYSAAFSPDKAFSPSLTDGWCSDRAPVAGTPEWISADFGSVRQIKSIYLLVDQFPTGATQHAVKLGLLPGEMMTAKRFAQSTKSGDILNIIFEQPVPARYLSVETALSPSWVAWKLIAVSGV